MANTLFPTNVGYIPTGTNGRLSISTTIIGRTITGSYEGIGFGQGGRPDYVELVQINMTKRENDGTLTQKGTITLNVNDLVAIAGIPSNLNIGFKEVLVCDDNEEKKMIILGSQTYT